MNYWWLFVSLISYCTWVLQEDLTILDFLVPISLLSFEYFWLFNLSNKKEKR